MNDNPRFTACRVAPRGPSDTSAPDRPPAAIDANELTMSLSFDALLSRLATQKLPKPGARLELEPLAGSADALAVAPRAGRGRIDPR